MRQAQICNWKYQGFALKHRKPHVKTHAFYLQDCHTSSLVSSTQTHPHAHTDHATTQRKITFSSQMPRCPILARTVWLIECFGSGVFMRVPSFCAGVVCKLVAVGLVCGEGLLWVRAVLCFVSFCWRAMLFLIDWTNIVAGVLQLAIRSSKLMANIIGEYPHRISLFWPQCILNLYSYWMRHSKPILHIN